MTAVVNKGECEMTYYKDKHSAFQAAQQGVIEAKNFYRDIVHDSASFGHQLKHLKKEVTEAYSQINSAMEIATEKQRQQLHTFQHDLKNIVAEVNKME